MGRAGLRMVGVPFGMDDVIQYSSTGVRETASPQGVFGIEVTPSYEVRPKGMEEV